MCQRWLILTFDKLLVFTFSSQASQNILEPMLNSLLGAQRLFLFLSLHFDDRELIWNEPQFIATNFLRDNQ